MAKYFTDVLPELDAMWKQDHITSDETLKLIRKYKREKNEGKKNDVREKIINGNLKLILSIVNKYSGNSKSNPLDLFQNGTIGMMIALEKFKTSKKIKFSTYATWWIRSMVQEATEMDFVISVPYDLKHICGHYEAYKSKIKNGEKIEEKDSKSFANKKERSLENASKILFNPKAFIDLDSPVPSSIGSADGGNLKYEEVVPDTRGHVNPEDIVSKDNMIENFKKIIKDSCSEREGDVLITRYFEGEGQVLGLEEVGKIHKLSRETIRLVEKSAIKKLRKKMPEEWVKNFFT